MTGEVRIKVLFCSFWRSNGANLYNIYLTGGVSFHCTQLLQVLATRLLLKKLMFVVWFSESQNKYGKNLTLTVKDDDPAVSTAGLGVVAEANMVTLHVKRLFAVTLVHFIATETGVS